MNSVKTVLLLGLLSGILLFGGEALGGTRGLQIGLMMAIGMNFFSYFFSDKIALMSYSAQAVTPEEAPDVYRRLEPVVRKLTQKMDLPMPKLWIIPEDSPNAFATGRDPQHASVAVTAGILRLMSDRELEGVIAHELGHVGVRERDQRARLGIVARRRALHLDEIGTENLELRDDRAARAFPEAHHGDERADANGEPQHGERATPRLAHDQLDRQAPRFRTERHPAPPSRPRRAHRA